MNYRTKPYTEEERQKALATYAEKIQYSPRYSCDTHEYRHVIIPKPLVRFTPPGLLDEKVWRSLGIKQSVGWEMYMRHNPEPHVLLFRRPKPAEKPAPLAVNIQHVNCKAGHDELKTKLQAVEQDQKNGVILVPTWTVTRGADVDFDDSDD